MKYSTELIEGIRNALQSAPDLDKNRPTHSKQDVIIKLEKEIRQLRAQGYSLEEIAKILHSNGVEISSQTLKNYLQRAKVTAQSHAQPTRKKAVKPKQDERSATTPDTAAPQQSGDIQVESV